jgi:hypothetical protein
LQGSCEVTQLLLLLQLFSILSNARSVLHCSTPCRHGTSMEPFVCTSVVQLLCRTVKLAWFDSDAPRAIVDECKALMERGSPGHYLLALKVLNMLVTEVNTATPGRTLTAVSYFWHTSAASCAFYAVCLLFWLCLTIFLALSGVFIAVC